MSLQDTIHAEAAATLQRLQVKHPELKQVLKESHGFAVFPSMGRASAVLGGAYGKGEVYEHGKSIGFATLSQMTLGVQVGGQTFSELVIFPKKPHLDQFRRGKVSFTANASLVFIKAAGSGTTNPDGVTAHAYSRGGMLLELSLGGQKFSFIPPEKLERLEKRARGGVEERGAAGEGEIPEPEEGDGKWRWLMIGRRHPEGEEEGQEAAGEEGEQEQRHADPLREVETALLRRGADGLRHAGSRVGGTLREHPVAGTLLGMGLTGVGFAAAAMMGPGHAQAASSQDHSR